MKVLNSIAKRVLLRLAPRTMTAVLSARARAYAHRIVEKSGLSALNRRLVAEIGSRVMSGPFRGLRLTPLTNGVHVGPLLLGTYEKELQPWWDVLLLRPWRQIIDIGGQVGYYAVGLAVKFPGADVIAFDTDRWARRAMKQMATANGVENLSIKGHCAATWLNRHVRPGALILSDCEGYEDQLFGELSLDMMSTATVIVEPHEHLVPGVSARIELRFASTHVMTRIASSRATELPPGHGISSLDADELRLVGAESRQRHEWLLLTPKIA